MQEEKCVIVVSLIELRQSHISVWCRNDEHELFFVAPNYWSQLLLKNRKQETLMQSHLPKFQKSLLFGIFDTIHKV